MIGRCRVDGEVLANLERYVSLAPLHQPNNLAPIRVLLARFPDLPQVACFDTAFHRGHSAVADHYAIPERFYAEGVRRYGFHGLSYEYVAERLREVAPAIAKGRVIIAHLGSGASMCALAKGRSVESTMGFTALDGLPMGTRPGQIDPGVLLYLITEKGMTAGGGAGSALSRKRPERPFRHQQRHAGAASERRAGAQNLRSTISSIAWRSMPECWPPRSADWMLSSSPPASANAPRSSARALPSGWRGSASIFDPVANEAGKSVISHPESRVGLYVVPTDEELMIARQTVGAVETRRRDGRRDHCRKCLIELDPDQTAAGGAAYVP